MTTNAGGSRLGLQIPTVFGDDKPSGADLIAWCRRAEELGFGSIWAAERILHQHPQAHMMTALTYAAAATTRVQLGTAVLLLNLHSPVEVAQQTATLQHLSGGRLVLGVSLGGRDDEYAVTNVSTEHRVGRLEEGMRLMRRLWTERDVSMKGRYFNVEAANVSLKPSPAIPMLIGGAAEPSLRRAGRIADGWVQGSRGTPESFAKGWALVQEGATAAGRDPSTLITAKLLSANPGTDRDKARSELQAVREAYYGPGFPMDQTAYGPAKEMAAMVRSFMDAGCQTVVLGLPDLDLGRLEATAELIPLVV